VQRLMMPVINLLMEAAREGGISRIFLREVVATPVVIWDGELRHEAALAALLLENVSPISTNQESDD